MDNDAIKNVLSFYRTRNTTCIQEDDHRVNTKVDKLSELPSFSGSIKDLKVKDSAKLSAGLSEEVGDPT